MKRRGHRLRKAEGQQQLGFPLHQGQVFGVAACWCLVLDGQHPPRAVLVAGMCPAPGLSPGPFMGSHAPVEVGSEEASSADPAPCRAKTSLRGEEQVRRTICS